MLKNYYKILEVEKTASDEEIKEAYRNLAKQFHPDTNPDPDAHQKFVDINEAHKILSNTEKRDLYNVQLTEQINQYAPLKAPTSIHVTRQKRAGRYQRGHYQRRNFNKKKHNYNQADHEEIRNRQALRKGAQIAFGYFSIITKIVSAFSLVLTLGLIIDYVLASKQAPEMVVYKSERAWASMEPARATFQTPNYRFVVPRSYGKYLFQGQSVELEATPMGRFVTKVYMHTWKVGMIEVTPIKSIYGGTFILIFLLFGFSAFAFRPENNGELLTYIGFINIILLFFLMRGLVAM